MTPSSISHRPGCRHLSAPNTIGILTIRADRTATDVVTTRLKVLVPSAIQASSQQQLQFIEGMQKLDVVEAFTEKFDGKRVAVDPANIITQDAAAGQQATYLRDQKQKTIIFPDVAVGDTLVWTVHIEHLQGIFPGEFADIDVFPRSMAVTSAHLIIEAPRSIDLQIGKTGDGATDKVETSGDIVRHDITVIPEPYAADEPGSVSPLDRDPAVRISTFKSYEEMGLAFGRAAMPKAAATPEIAALADEITRGIADRKAQAAAIDTWMKKNIRYVAVYLSLGRVVPNEAAAILKNKYGDCKDKVTLMAALLAAKGIASEAALINLGNAYQLPEPATMGALNHVIIYLPDFDLYDDPTVNVAAFGVLAPQAYDKPVIRVSATDAKLARTPPMRPDDHIANAKTTLKVAADGTITGQTRESNTGIFGVVLRSVGAAVQSVGDETVAARALQGYNTPGGGSFNLGNMTATEDPVVITGSFTLNDKFKAPAQGARSLISFGMPLTVRPGNFLLGSRLAGRALAFVCYAGRQIEDIDATFDAKLPLPTAAAPTSIVDPAFTYRATSEVNGRTLRIHREFISRVPGQVCQPELEEKIANDLKAVFVNEYTGFGFASPPPPPVATTQPPPAAAAPQPPVATAQQSPAAAPQQPPAAQPPAPATQQPRPPQVFEVKRTATAGQKQSIDFLGTIKVDCSSLGYASVSIVEQPQHGTVTAEHGSGRSSFPKDNPRSACNERETVGTLVYYEPQPGFAGSDSVTIDATFVSGSTTKRHYTITVNPASGAIAAANPAAGGAAPTPGVVTPAVGTAAAAPSTTTVPAVPSTPPPAAPPTAAAPTAPKPAQTASATATPQIVQVSRVAAAGRQLQVAFLYDLNPDCSSAGFVAVRFIEQPKHGAVGVENGTGFSGFPQENIRYDCNKRRTEGVLLTYNPEPGYIGPELDPGRPDLSRGRAEQAALRYRCAVTRVPAKAGTVDAARVPA